MNSICSMWLEPEGERQTRIILQEIKMYPSDDFGKKSQKVFCGKVLFFFFFFPLLTTRVAQSVIAQYQL